MLDEYDQQEFAEYRMSPKHFYIGAVSTILFMVMDIGSVFAALTNFDGSFPRPIPIAIFLGVCWTPFVVMGIYIIAAYFHERLILLSDSVIQRAVFTEKKIQLHEITILDWDLLPNSGLITVHTKNTKFRVDTSNFLKQDRIEIIEYFRSSVSEELQTGWEESQERIAKFYKYRDKYSWRSYAIISLVFFVGSIAPIYLWTFDIGNYLLGIAAACIALGIASLFGSVSDYKKAMNHPEESAKA